MSGAVLLCILTQSKVIDSQVDIITCRSWVRECHHNGQCLAATIGYSPQRPLTLYDRQGHPWSQAKSNDSKNDIISSSMAGPVSCETNQTTSRIFMDRRDGFYQPSGVTYVFTNPLSPPSVTSHPLHDWLISNCWRISRGHGACPELVHVIACGSHVPGRHMCLAKGSGVGSFIC
jgi:hypothetical protein